MESKLITSIIAIAILIGLAGCDAQAGPNDPVVDGKKLDQQREKDWSPEDKAAMHPRDPMQSGKK